EPLKHLIKNKSFGYVKSDSDYILINLRTLDAFVIDEIELANLSKRLRCVTGANKLAVGASYFLQVGQIAGWIAVGGIAESGVNIYRYFADEEMNYNFTKDMVAINAREFDQKDKEYRRMQQE